jgi:hypothetical protein
MDVENQQSVDIVVDEFRQILIWPLLLQFGAAKQFCMKTVSEKLTASNWRLVQESQDTNAWKIGDDDWYKTKDENGDYVNKHEYDYSEIVYFHSFVRNFLYGGDDLAAEKRPMRVFHPNLRATEASSQSESTHSKLKDLRYLYVQLKNNRDFYLKVERIEAYLADTGVLVIAIEVFCNKHQDRALEKPLKLSDALDLQNLLRMVFPRRWSSNGDPSETPLQMAWAKDSITEGRQSFEIIEDSRQDFTDKGSFTKIVQKNAEIPVAAHLAYLLRPLIPYDPPIQPVDITYKQIEDQRIPSMSFIAVEEPRQITEWDFARIAFFDSHGESTVSCYSDDFMQDWEKLHAYDRFWQRKPSLLQKNLSDQGKLDGHNEMVRTRWLCSGYGFSVVGSSKDSVFMGQIKSNFHHHYFRMGFIAHFHRASLLALREELSKSMNKNGVEFHDAVIRIQKNCIRFRTRFWYHEVSTQLQGQEIFRWWSNQLGNQELFDKVTSDVEALASLVRTEIAEKESENIKSLTFYSLLVGYIGVLVGCFSAVLAHLLGDWSKVTSNGYIELIIFLICVVICFFPFRVMARRVNR